MNNLKKITPIDQETVLSERFIVLDAILGYDAIFTSSATNSKLSQTFQILKDNFSRLKNLCLLSYQIE